MIAVLLPREIYTILIEDAIINNSYYFITFNYYNVMIFTTLNFFSYKQNISFKIYQIVIFKLLLL